MDFQVLFFFVFPTLAFGYGTRVDTSCSGTASCGAIVDGEEFGSTATGELECSFGYTAQGSTERCVVPCDEDILYNCSCVSEAVAVEGLKTDSAGDVRIAILCFILLAIFMVGHYWRMRSYKKSLEKYESVIGKDVKEDIVPGKPRQWCFFVIYIILIAVGANFAASAASLRNSGFWEGC